MIRAVEATGPHPDQEEERLQAAWVDWVHEHLGHDPARATIAATAGRESIRSGKGVDAAYEAARLAWGPTQPSDAPRRAGGQAWTGMVALAVPFAIEAIALTAIFATTSLALTTELVLGLAALAIIVFGVPIGFAVAGRVFGSKRMYGYRAVALGLVPVSLVCNLVFIFAYCNATLKSAPRAGW